MINCLIFNNHKADYELERIFRSYYLPYKLEMLINRQPPQDNYMLSQVNFGEKLCLLVQACDNGRKIEKTAEISAKSNDKAIETELCNLLCCVMEQLTGIKLEWGILTGIRPTKYIGKLLNESKNIDETEKYIREKLLVSDKKLDISKKILQIQAPIINSIKENSFSLYISIPFCPTRCSYCSFISHSMSSAKKLIPQYVSLLVDEIKSLARIASELGLQLDTIYFGGGTPTSLSAEQLKMLFGALDFFDLSGVREFTVEAGRPDTITQDKLVAIKQAGAGRISINPQTMQDDVLKIIGRNHTAQDIVNAFELANTVGFDSINADLIAGLPGDNFDGFADSIDKVLQLKPTNITVHNLALKRSSTLFWDEEKTPTANVSEMIEYSQEKLMKSDYQPYYLYRQKNILENHENIGYALANKESLYNIFIMEEVQTILAAGCGAGTKLVKGGENGIERVFNYKFPYEYIDRYELMMEKKKAIYDFYRNK